MPGFPVLNYLLEFAQTHVQETKRSLVFSHTKDHFKTQRVSQILSSQMVLLVKNPPANAGDARDVGSIPGSGRSPGAGNGNPFQYSCLENSMDTDRLQSTGPQRVEYDTEIRLIIFFAAKDGEALYSQQKQDWELTVAQIMNSLLPNSDLN